MSTSSTNAKLVIIGDSIIVNFDRFFLPFRTLNVGISGHKIQNVLWRVFNDFTSVSGIRHYSL